MLHLAHARKTHRRLVPAGALVLAALLAIPATSVAQGAAAPATPPEMVATYNALADTILGAKRAESELVRSILAATHAHAQVQLGRAQRALTSRDAKVAQAAVEALAADVAQLATEGDNAVAAVRKRLIEGGHHHNAAGEAQGLYDEGFVVVTRAAKQQLLDSSRAIGRMAAAPASDALEAEWKKVDAVYRSLVQPAK